MVEHRSAKRRRISNDGRDQRQDVEIPETPPSTDVDGAYPAAMDVDDSELDVVRPGTPSKSSRRQSTGAASTTENNHVKDEDTQSQSVRASSRRRKAPTRYEDELETIETPRRSRLSTTTPSKTTVSGSGARKGKKKTQADDGESQKCPAVVVKAISSRNKRRNSTKDIVQSHSDASPESESQPPEVESTLVDDGLDDKYDPVAVQLQEMLQPQDEVHEEINQPMALPEYAERFKNLCESEFRHEIVDLSKLILEKVTGKRFSPLKGLDAEYQKVYQLVEQTVTAGEGNSMLVMGSRGSGKTSMVESIIASLLKQHGDDFHVVRLNGFFHTDDRLSLREIWRQLGREMETEDDASKINSYADTMATLLALLSHPEELSQGTDRSNGLTTAKSVVIILDEFDLFATHPRQTLLYNLFDIAQARKAPLAVLGLTTKVDVTETLEKRVKSRFSHRYVYLPLARSFEAFSDACLSPLMVEMHEAESHDFAHKNPKKAQQLLMAWQEYLKVYLPLSPFTSLSKKKLIFMLIQFHRASGKTKISRSIYNGFITKPSQSRIFCPVHYSRCPISIAACWM